MVTTPITLGLASPGDASTLAQMARDYIETGLGCRTSRAESAS